MPVARPTSDRVFRLLQGWGVVVALATFATGVLLTTRGADAYLGLVQDPFDRKVFAALCLGLPGCVLGALCALLACRDRAWDGLRLSGATLVCLNLATVAAWGVLYLLKAGAIRF